LLEGEDQQGFILDAADRVVEWLVESFCPKDQHADQWNVNGLRTEMWGRFGIDLKKHELIYDPKQLAELTARLKELVRARYAEREQVWSPERMRMHERLIMLQVVDGQWKDHLLAMDHLKEGIGLRGYGQRDPLVEYKRESFEMFEAMMQRFQEDTVRNLYLMQVIEPSPAADKHLPGGDEQEGGPVAPGERGPDELGGGDGTGVRVPRPGGDRRPPKRARAATSVDEIEEEFQRRKRRELEQARMAGAGDYQPVQQVVRSGAKIGRNDPCPCGSGKKYKKCCGA